MTLHTPASDTRGSAPADAAESLPATLRRNAPLVPLDTASGRALVAVIAILTFLAALCAGAAELVSASSAQWRSSVAREATIQVRPRQGRDIEADVARAAAVARAAPGVQEVRATSHEESARLLEPWLGAGLDFGELPVPRIVVVRLGEGPRPDLAPLRRALAEGVPGATLDDHAQWLARLSTMAATVVGVGVGLVVLVIAAAGLAVAFATRGAMAGNREVVEVLHFVGAEDDYIARAFQRRFFQLGLVGGGIGGLAALAAIGGAGALAAAWRASPAGDQIEALFGAFAIGWRGIAIVVLIALAVSAVAGAMSRITVRQHLAAAG
ncbi:MAG TPA: ABC transporter permease [Beijerinckiaceae bacterium]|jgi:cell division transport system permease protein